MTVRHRRRLTTGDLTRTAGDVATAAIERALARLPGRVAGINATTRDGVRAIIREAIEKGLSPKEAGDLVREWSGWDEYRAERIARTEMLHAYNAAALDTYGAYGVEQVVADDGDGDEECAARHGQVFDVDEADGIEDHPNGTLDWIPVAGEMTPDQVRAELHDVRPIRGM